MRETTCKISDCHNPAVQRGWCWKHYARWRRHGDPLVRQRADAPAVFEQLVALDTDDCVVWPGATVRGYGIFKQNKAVVRVHREALRRRVGEPPTPTAEAAHGECHNPACMNYRHLRWATHQENVDDMRRDGTWLRGENNSQARLTEDQVREIRRRYESDRRLTYPILAGEYGVNENTIASVIRRENWGWLA